jgi:CDP-diacylglycerol--inositol 3-phosphatidyltransferase
MTGTIARNAKDVILYIPNIIGYIRVICAIVSYMIMIYIPHYWLLGIILYLLNFIGDLFDGLIARKLNQTSMYGSVLDMITDRCSTTGLLYILSNEYIIISMNSHISSDNINNITISTAASSIPIYRTLFLFLIILDISSHWVQMHSTLALHSNNNDNEVHHKSDVCNKDKNFLVRWFYKYYYFFGYLCVGTEFTYILLYIQLHLHPYHPIASKLHILLLVCIPGCCMKQLVNVAQLVSSFYSIAQHDADIANNHNKQKTQ